MSKYIATRAVRGANALVYEAETMLYKALAEKGPETVVEFPNTAYYLPLIYAMTGEKLPHWVIFPRSLRKPAALLHPIPSAG